MAAIPRDDVVAAKTAGAIVGDTVVGPSGPAVGVEAVETETVGGLVIAGAAPAARSGDAATRVMAGAKIGVGAERPGLGLGSAEASAARGSPVWMSMT